MQRKLSIYVTYYQHHSKLSFSPSGEDWGQHQGRKLANCRVISEAMGLAEMKPAFFTKMWFSALTAYWGCFGSFKKCQNRGSTLRVPDVIDLGCGLTLRFIKALQMMVVLAKAGGHCLLRVFQHTTCMMLDSLSLSFFFFFASHTKSAKVYKLKSNLRTKNVWNQSSLTDVSRIRKQWERASESHQVVLSIVMLFGAVNLPPFSLKSVYTFTYTEGKSPPPCPGDPKRGVICTHTYNASQQPTRKEAFKGKSHWGTQLQASKGDGNIKNSGGRRGWNELRK